MGLTGVWCMHFIGNRAIILESGQPEIQLVYNPGYTTLSVFLPIIGLTIAFSAAEFPSKSKLVHSALLVCTGVFAGLSVVGMHYIGNLGISNYILHYTPQFLAASIIIAIGDCLTVLVLFYTWREKWISAWWKRLLCAIVLAGGVTSMHFTASTNCQYRFKGPFNSPAAIRSRNVQVSVAGALCVAAAVTVFGVLLFTRRRAAMLRTRSQKVMLACAMFDPDGRILVTTEGILPAREITDKYQHRTFNEEFDTSHPVFQWIFRVTRHWAGVSELIPKMKTHLGAAKADGGEESRPVSSSSSATFEPETYSDYSVVFRERFCTAAASLAAAMHLPVEKIGVLYDRIVETGTLKPEDKVGRRRTLPTDKIVRDVEAGLTLNLFGKGQLLFLTKQLTPDDADKLLNAGFKFASVGQIGRNVAETMQIPLPALEVHFEGLRGYVEYLQSFEKTGTWLSCFAMIPKPNSKGFDVAVQKENQDQLPDVQLLPLEPQQWQVNFVHRMDGMRPRQCIVFLENRNNADAQRAAHEQHFATLMLQAVNDLGKQVPMEWFRDARFVSRPVYAHYTQEHRNRGMVSVVFAFCVIADLHTSVESCSAIARVPLSFFSTRQRCYAGSPDHSILARDIHQEFGPLLARKTNGKALSSKTKVSLHLPKSKTRLSKQPTPKVVSRRSSMGNSDESSMHELMDNPRRMGEVIMDKASDADRDNVWGGILVNSETVVKSDSKSEFSHHSHNHLGTGMKVSVGTARQEDTFVDELFATTRARFTQPKVGY